jgi:hypothetical protein
VVREGVGTGGEMNQALYADMNKKKIVILTLKKKNSCAMRLNLSILQENEHVLDYKKK